jgi:delta-aminolevulinic acid dehydratase/porphobilinogen synthase
MNKVMIDVDEHIIRWDQVNDLVTMPNNEIVEKEGLEDNEEVLRHIKTTLRTIAQMSLRELKKKKEEAEAAVSEPEMIQEATRKPGRYMGVAGSYEDYQ